MDESNPRKRPRPVVSCLRCRDKKLKCDRTAPCENCIRAKTSDSCTYQRNNSATSKEGMPVSKATTTAVEDLQSRLARVEELLGIRSSNSPDRTEDTKPQMIGTVVVKGSRSVFHGQNDRTTLLNQFLEVKDFIHELSKDKQIQASAKQIKFLQNKCRSKIGSPDSLVGSEFSMALLNLREFLPPKPYCDRLVDIYFQHFERTFRVLHIPTFLRRYEQIWADEHVDICSSSTIIPKLTVVMTMAHHMGDALQQGDDRTYKTYLKGPAMDLVHAWLDELDRKQRTELSTLQVEVLLLLSRSLRGIQPEKLWNSTGALVRSAMVMGLNVNPAGISGITPYNAELRRRIWATILEMDLQASMFCGMPLVVPDLDPCSLVPSNINDVDFDESSGSLPASQPIHTYTDSIYQVVLASSLSQRIKALSVVQHSTPDVQEGISLGRMVEESLLQKPQALNLDNSNERPVDGGSLLHCVLLDLYLRRPILRLYNALLLGQQQNTPALVRIRKSCLESSRIVLSYQDLYTVPALATVTDSPWAHQNFFYQCCKMDVLWAALTLCEQIKHHYELERDKASYDSLPLVRAVKTTITHLVERLGQKGSDLKDIVFLALVLQSVQLPETSPDRSHLLQQAATKTLARCREKLLQPLAATHSLPPAASMKPPSVDATPVLGSMSSAITPPISNPRLTPISVTDTAFPMNLPASSEQWFGDLSDLALEYNTFQAGVFDANDPLNFGIAQNWNWEHMWQ
ncbi:DNA binding [Ascochyta rabiei]|uniref:DNA binding n=1 Tax=Didymella rabiei TaxID=5454 RepID=A0A163F9Y0_DIDRA|nr:DNA binding [Ascochyta rabiei]